MSSLSKDSVNSIRARMEHAALNANPSMVEGLSALALRGKESDIQLLAGVAKSLSELVGVLCGDMEYLLQDRASILDELSTVSERLEIFELRENIDAEQG